MDDLQPKQDKPTKPAPDKKMIGMLMAEAGFEFAFLIAVPLLAGVLGGQWLDRKTSHHFFVIVGILLGLAVSCLAIYKRINDYRNLLK